MFDVTPLRPVLSLRLERLDLQGAPILGALDLDLNPRETVAITGPSGVGKTTLLRVLAGLQTSFKGQLQPANRLAMVFQDPRLLPWRSAVRNLMICAGLDREGALAALDEVGLAHRADHRPDTLSLGQQRRLALARAFAVEPSVLLMDEPFVSLDETTAAQMRDLFKRLRDDRGVATVIVTHDMDEAHALADRILVLEGTPARFCS